MRCKSTRRYRLDNFSYLFISSSDFDICMWSEGEDSINVIVYSEIFPDFIYLLIIIIIIISSSSSRY